jgi:paraquat-inducible protein A
MVDDGHEERTAASADLVRCHDCDLLQGAPALTAAQSARCSRCGALLYYTRESSLDRTLGLTLAALLLLVVANCTEFMTFEFKGRSQSNFILTGIFELHANGFGPLAVLIGFTSILAPLLHLSGMLYVLLPLRLGRRPWGLAPVFRVLQHLRPWAMLEVYVLGVFVAIVKLNQLASIELGTGFYAFVGLIVISSAAYDALDARLVWGALDVSSGARGAVPSTRARAVMSELVPCHACAMLTRLPTEASHSEAGCPRCRAPVHRRKPNSVNRTWALVIAAAILYVPANVYPVLKIEILGKTEADTIYTGVVELFGAGMWEIGLLVFFASITVPMLKLLGLTFLLISVQRRSRWRPRDRTVLYRMVEYIGRWSMIDMFMTSILVALVQLGAVATIVPGVGATCFASVVVITMFAASSFDPRLIWDNLGGDT